MSLNTKNQSPVTVGHIGYVDDVLTGRVNPSLAKLKFRADDFKYGFEVGSPQNIKSLGEALLVNGKCYATATDPDEDKEYLQTISGDEFYTTGFFVIPKDTKPTLRLQESFTKQNSMQEFYTSIYTKLQQPFAFAGFFEFAELCCTAIAKAPIYNEEIFANLDGYFPTPPVIKNNVRAFLVGVVADYTATKNDKLLNKLTTALYNNPLDKKDKLTTHAHAITFSQEIHSVSAITTNAVNSTVHVFEDQTLINNFNVEIFAINDVVDCGESAP